MLTLHGFPYSNYHNIVKHTLMLKGIAFHENIVYPNSPEILAVNPTGKAPAITTESGTQLSETTVLVDYLEDKYTDIPLYPSDADKRAQVRQIMKISELYIELPARRIFPAVLSNKPADEKTVKEVRSVLDRGTRSLNALATFSPYLLGEELSLADIYLRYALFIPKMVGPTHLDWDVMTEIPALAEWDAMMADSDISRTVDAENKANTKDFMDYISGNTAKK
jgi:glutathione S-transferase